MALPKKVKEAAEQADKDHAAMYVVDDPESSEKPAKEIADAIDEDIISSVVTEAEIVTEPEPEVGSEAWKQKYSSLQGKYDAEVPKLHEENSALRDQLNALQTSMSEFGRTSSADVADVVIPSLLTDEEIEDYGEDLVSMIKRAAREEVSPELTRLQAENDQLRESMGSMSNSVAQSAQASIYRQLDTMLPTWKEINKSPEFLDWLGKPDVYSGVSRQDLLTRAFGDSDAARVLQFFNGYLTEQTAVTAGAQQNTLDTLVAPGRQAATAGAKQQGQIWTTAQVDAFYKAARNGAYDAKTKLAYEAEIANAAREGRIID